jgi:acyl dehydratase
MERGRVFEEFEVGEVFETRSRRLDDGAIAAFAAVSGDDNPLHTDDAYARRAGFDGRVAHGLLGTAVTSGLVAGLRLTRGTLIALVSVRCDFLLPIRPDMEVHARVRVAQTRATSKPDRGVIVLEAELLDAAGHVLQRSQFVELVRRRGHEPHRD